MARQFDELNLLSTDYEEYFGEMAISKEQKARRIKLAQDLEDEIWPILALIAIHVAYSSVDWSNVQQQFESAYKTAVEKENGMDDYLEKYASILAAELMQSTRDNIKKDRTLSYDRARLIAENEANTAINYLEDCEAKENGATYKEWITMMDDRVRHTHAVLDGAKIPVGNFFNVGGSLMMHPRDLRFGASASEYINCRCSVRYSNDFGEEIVAKSGENDIISGARILDPDSKEGKAFAEMYYSEVRSFTTDASKIAKNTGFDESEIRKIKGYLFENGTYYNEWLGKWCKFEPDCAIAQSWQRLMIGKDIKPHDLTLIRHEALEMEIKEENPGISHDEAHYRASLQYDYQKESEEYYANLKESSKSG